MKEGVCVHWYDYCATAEKCSYKLNGKCIKDGKIPERSMFIDKLKKATVARVQNKYNMIRNLNN